MDKQTISVIVPVYKVAPYLESCVRSICAQTHENLEIILVDDGSPDECPAMCDALANEDERIVVIHKENGGVSSARNVGLEIATGAYIGFIDGDDEIAPEMYQRLLETLVEQGVEVALCAYRVYAPSGEQVRVAETREDGRALTQVCALLALTQSIGSENRFDDTLFPCWNKLSSKRLWESVRFDETLTVGEDRLAVFQIVSLTDSVGICREPLYFYKSREGSASYSDACIRSGAVYQMAQTMLEHTCQGAVVWDACLENLISIAFSHIHSLAGKNLSNQYETIRRDILRYRVQMKKKYGGYALKYRGGLFFLRYMPHLLWRIKRWRVTHTG